MESLVAGQVVNRIEVDPETEKHALVALQRKLDLPARTAAKD
jgi:quinolinate synthase